MPLPYPVAPIGGSIPLDKIPRVETELNVAGYTLGPAYLGPYNSNANPSVIGTDQWKILSIGTLGNQLGIPTFGDILSGNDPKSGTSKTVTDAATSWLFSGRVIAIILGLIFIAAGFFLLSKGPAVNIITSNVKKIATGA